jgi:hypothetical protein
LHTDAVGVVLAAVLRQAQRLGLAVEREMQHQNGPWRHVPPSVHGWMMRSIRAASLNILRPGERLLRKAASVRLNIGIVRCAIPNSLVTVRPLPVELFGDCLQLLRDSHGDYVRADLIIVTAPRLPRHRAYGPSLASGTGLL